MVGYFNLNVFALILVCVHVLEITLEKLH